MGKREEVSRNRWSSHFKNLRKVKNHIYSTEKIKFFLNKRQLIKQEKNPQTPTFQTILTATQTK